MGPTDNDVDFTCKHATLLPRRATDLFDKCAICGKFVRDSLGYVNTTTIGITTGVSNVGYSGVPQPVIQQPTMYIIKDAIKDNDKTIKKINWSPPPGAPKKRKPF